MEQNTLKMGYIYSFRVECCESWLGLCGNSPDLLKSLGSGSYWNYLGTFPGRICLQMHYSSSCPAISAFARRNRCAWQAHLLRLLCILLFYLFFQS